MPRHRTAWTVAPFLLLALVAGAAARHGERGRVFAAGSSVRPVASPADAFRQVQAAGLRGRVLLLFDRYPHAHTTYEDYLGGAALGDSNWVEIGIFENRFRALWWIVPDAEWEQVRRQPALYKVLGEAPGMEGALSCYTASGVPFLAVRASALPRLEEPVLAYVDPSRFDAGQAAGLLRGAGLRADLTLVLRGE